MKSTPPNLKRIKGYVVQYIPPYNFPFFQIFSCLISREVSKSRSLNLKVYLENNTKLKKPRTCWIILEMAVFLKIVKRLCLSGYIFQIYRNLSSCFTSLEKPWHIWKNTLDLLRPLKSLNSFSNFVKILKLSSNHLKYPKILKKILIFWNT